MCESSGFEVYPLCGRPERSSSRGLPPPLPGLRLLFPVSHTMSFLSVLLLSTTFSCASAPPVAPSQQQQEATVADAFAKVRDQVVTIYTLSNVASVETMGQVTTSGGTGSGVVISKDGQILTAAHVVQTASKILVEFMRARGWRRPLSAPTRSPISRC